MKKLLEKYLEIFDWLKQLNNKIPKDAPKIQLDSVTTLIIGIDVVVLNKDLAKYLKIGEYDMSLKEMCEKVYGVEITREIESNLNISSYNIVVYEEVINKALTMFL